MVMRNTTLILSAIAFATALNCSGQSLTQFRYWFDDDAASAASGAVGNQQFTLTSLGTAALPTGPHRVTWQFQDDNGAWSVPVTYTFTRLGGQQTAWQYWFDDDPATLINTNIGPTAVIDLASVLDASALGSGPHTITLRTKDALGDHSVPITYAFDVFTALAEIPGLAHATVFPNPAIDRVTLLLEATRGLDLSVRVLDAAGRVVLGAQRMVFNGKGRLDIDLEALAQGSYTLRISSAQGEIGLPMLKL